MDKQNNIDHFSDLCKTVVGLPGKLINAALKGLQEPSDLTCVKDQELNFDLIENDVKNIHRTLMSSGNNILGSRLILDKTQELMEIKTYTEKGNKTYCNTTHAKFRRVINAPKDIKNELEQQRRIELNLKL